ncbi:MAG: hypothetical protein ACE37H_17985 [Phycisphaeraceae bacterium]
MKTCASALIVLCLAVLGCANPHTYYVENPVVTRFTVPGVGACQGIAMIDGSLWIYGDKDGRGVIKRLTYDGIRPSLPYTPQITDTGEVYELTLYRDFSTRNQPGVRLDPDPIPHPTGLTHHPDYGTFIGNTVNQKGTIYHLIWEGFTESGNLDSWVRNKTIDDLATNGTRPEFVRFNGRWLIATADYGDEGNQLRLYDPQLLAKAQRTSEPGVLVAAFDCGPFVQSMHWIDEQDTLVLVQNQTAGLGYRLTLLTFGGGAAPPTVERVIDLGQPTDELEGFVVVGDWAVLTSASREDNVTIIRWPIATDR